MLSHTLVLVFEHFGLSDDKHGYLLKHISVLGRGALCQMPRMVR